MRIKITILLLLFFIPLYVSGQPTENNSDYLQSETPPMYKGKHFALGMYEALYGATFQDISKSYDHPEFYVELLFYVNSNDKVDSVLVHRSSGYDYIDNKILQLSKRFAKRHKNITSALDENGEHISSYVLLPMYFNMYLPLKERGNGKNSGKTCKEEPNRYSSQYYWAVKGGTDDNVKGYYWPEKLKSH